jgi:hypothetical protein
MTRVGLVFGLALVVGSVIAMWLPDSDSQIEEDLFSEITYHQGELKLITDQLVALRNTVKGSQQAQIDQHLQKAADWLTAFRPTGETHQERTAYLISQRDTLIDLVDELAALRESLMDSNPLVTE